MAKTRKNATKTKTTAQKSPTKKQTRSARIRRPSISLNNLKKYIIPFTAALAAAVLGVLWYYLIYTNPQRIFWGMVENNLSTSSISKVSSQESGSFSSQEVVQVTFSPQLAVHNVRDITDNTQQQPTRIKLEAIGTRQADYQHYLLIDRPAAEGQEKLDYGRVYNMWLKSDEGGAQLLNSNLFGPVLFGRMPENIRHDLMNDLKKAYDVNFETVKKMNLDGRRTYSFEVEVNLASYAAAAQKYARLLKLPVAEQIDPASYSEDDKTKVTIYVDALSRQVRKMHFSSANTFEDYSSYGISKKVTPPTRTVSSEQFQDAINSVSEN